MASPPVPEVAHAARLRTEHGHTVIEDFDLVGDWTDETHWIGEALVLGTMRVRHVAARFEQPLHPAPRRQVGVVLSGELEVEVHSGDRRRFGPGSVVFLEDTTGSGHVTRVLEPASYLELHLSQDEGSRAGPLRVGPIDGPEPGTTA